MTPRPLPPPRPPAFGRATRPALLRTGPSACLPACWRAWALACLCLWLGLCLPPGAARAQAPAGAAPAAMADATAADPLADRMHQLTQHLRCLVCQNESLADSHAPLALDLKREIRALMAQGQSDDEIRAFLTRRYGDFVNYQPPLRASTLLLWAGPLLILAAGLWLVWTQVRAGQRPVADAVDAVDAGDAADLVDAADPPRAAAAPGPAQPAQALPATATPAAPPPSRPDQGSAPRGAENPAASMPGHPLEGGANTGTAASLTSVAVHPHAGGRS